MSFPISRISYREFASDWSGDVVSCDIDRTYLATKFSTLKGMLRVPFEWAIDKQDIAGMAALLREVRRGPAKVSRHTPLYFLSASPAQLRSVIERKMMLDGLEYDGTTFKDWFGVVLGGRPGRFREQIGFKVTALLQARAELPVGASDVLIGDDLESDALSYTLYADLIAGRIPLDRIVGTLRRHGVARNDVADIGDRVGRLGHVAGVKRIYIRLERHDPLRFIEFAPYVVAARGAFQMAIGLFAAGSISIEGVVRVGMDVVRRGVKREVLSDWLSDAIRRGIADRDTVAGLRDRLADDGVLVAARLPSTVDVRWAAAAERDRSEPWTPLALL